ncbi:ABC transporter ATP-binding protein [Candidatus Contubernalis alkaliaceticus]|uniref:ABC transporter ATP-binding protein n=1 Tax=Candidatus Contubernalis alkaliaceticus TaxID=338645 RepID=UPI001F4C4DDA|nr:ABC transporter ATP-binding protein [Candidatus Contubernalis alkalaceticus]UNC92795.1 ABC transporter ATP-binding protein [Candidatus Contubernalis alkalaceticus]
MIKIDNMAVEYKDFNSSLLALEGVNLEVDSGETCAIIGPSGCGKTTLLFVLAGLTPFQRGSVMINEKPVSSKRKKTALILQDFGLLPWKNVWDNTALGLTIRGLSPDVKEKRVRNILQHLDLFQFKDYFPGQLSGGMRQRVAIARALTLRPDLLLMDEPFSALDAITREELQSLLLTIWHERPMSIVMVTHSIEEAVYLGQRIIIFSSVPGYIVSDIKNPYFGDPKLRERPEFYTLCHKVRTLLEEGKSNGKNRVQ